MSLVPPPLLKKTEREDKYGRTLGQHLCTMLVSVTFCLWSVCCHRNYSWAVCHPELPWREEATSKLLRVEC